MGDKNCDKYIRCEECGGFINKGSCVCELTQQIREALKKKFELTDEELDLALEEGRIYLTRREVEAECTGKK